MIHISDTGPFHAASIGAGNKLFIYAVARILAENTGYALTVAPTRIKCHSGLELIDFQFEQLDGNRLDTTIGIVDATMLTSTIAELSAQLLQTNCGATIDGYFIRYELLKPYKQRIKTFYAPFVADSPDRNEGDLVIMLRNSNIDPTFKIPAEYYTSILETTKFNRLYFSAEDPRKHTILLDQLKKYNPIFIEGDTMKRLKIISGFDTIVACQGTYGFWCSFLSRATKIYYPLATVGPNKLGDPLVNIMVDDEPRFIIVPTDNPPKLMESYV